MSNTTQCVICERIINLKSEEVKYLDDLPCCIDCFEEEFGED